MKARFVDISRQRGFITKLKAKECTFQFISGEVLNGSASIKCSVSVHQTNRAKKRQFFSKIALLLTILIFAP